VQAASGVDLASMNSAMSSARQGMGNAMSMAKVGHQKVKDSQQIQDGMDMLQQGAERAGNLALAAAGEGAVAAQTPGNRATFGGHFKSERIRWSAHCPVVGLAAQTIVVARMCFGTAGSFVTDEIHSPVVLRGVAASRADLAQQTAVAAAGVASNTLGAAAGVAGNSEILARGMSAVGADKVSRLIRSPGGSQQENPYDI
jgi:hypothetical protein